MMAKASLHGDGEEMMAKASLHGDGEEMMAKASLIIQLGVVQK